MISAKGVNSSEIKESKFNKWLSQLTLPNQQSYKQLSIALNFYHKKEEQNQALSYLLGRGVEMVEILLSLGMDSDSLCAGLLLPLVNKNLTTIAEIDNFFGKVISNLIFGVLEMNYIHQLKSIQKEPSASEQLKNVRRMLLAMVEDFRCVIIKLAECVIHLREMKKYPEEDRVLAAKECMNVYAPLANRLGIGQLKWELEDLCFRYLRPMEYKRIATLLHERRADREKFINNFVMELCEIVKKEGILAEIYGRPKHIYGIWLKMQKKSLTFDELFDVLAIRIVVERLQDCYAALGIVHTHYRHLPNEFDDYIANAKPNGYQSIHTVVLGKYSRAVEIQIRTYQMHENAELGVAAHWKYKEGVRKSEGSSYEERIIWLRKLLSWQDDINGSGEILDELRSQVFDDRVYVFTPSGDVVDLPKEATPLDFAYHIHSDIGNRCIGAKVKGRIVPFHYQLKMGDQVEIITQKYSNPSRDWLNMNLGYLKTSKARAKLRSWFRQQEREKNIFAGRQMLDEEFSRLGILAKDAEKLLIARYNLNSIDELLIGVSVGDIRINQLVNFLHGHFNNISEEEADRRAVDQLTQKGQQKADRDLFKKGQIIVEGVGNLMHHVAQCCQPIPGDEIIGFITQGRGISIHRFDCDQLKELRIHFPERIVEAAWDEHYSSGCFLGIRLTADDRSGLLRDITTVLVNQKVNVLGVSSRSNVKKQLATIDMNIEVYNLQTLSLILAKLNQIPGIIQVRRLYGKHDFS